MRSEYQRADAVQDIEGGSQEMRAWIFAALVMLAAAMSRESFAQTAQLRAGAAKVDVTPAEDALPRNY